ncbi:MAG: protein translocase subunit SecF [Cardiobacteriaceae bacterium]|nr:protein translocase subunit SecF [Cardiobacteriaceae bacterium]
MQIKHPFIHFMKYASKGMWLSSLLTAAAILLIIFRGFNFGLEFTGGATIEVQYPQAVDTANVRAIVEKIVPDAGVVQYGSSHDIQIRFAEQEGVNIDKTMGDIVSTLQEDNANVKITGQSKVGGQYKEELVSKGLLAIGLACIGMIVYLGLRFEWKFALGAVLAQLHDVIVTAGVFSLMGWTFDLNVLAALLAILGYSVNDTVVVYDRIRENFRKLPAVTPGDVIDISINQTLARTLVTSLTTLLSVIALALFGGSILAGFSIAMIIGIVFGTYSSIFVASAIVFKMGVKHEDLMPRASQPIDDLP